MNLNLHKNNPVNVLNANDTSFSGSLRFYEGDLIQNGIRQGFGA